MFSNHLFWFHQPLSLKRDILVSKFAFKWVNLCTATARCARSRRPNPKKIKGATNRNATVRRRKDSASENDTVVKNNGGGETHALSGDGSDSHDHGSDSGGHVSSARDSETAGWLPHATGSGGASHGGGGGGGGYVEEWELQGGVGITAGAAGGNGDVFLDSSLGSEGEGEGSGSDRYRSAPPPLPPRAGTSGLSGACAFVALDVDGVGDDANFSPRAKNEDGGLNGDGVGRCKLNSVYP
jgi:hypothetical protein